MDHEIENEIDAEINAAAIEDEIEDAEQLEEIFSLYEHLEVMFDEKIAVVNARLDAIIEALPKKEAEKVEEKEEEIVAEAAPVEEEVVIEKPKPRTTERRKWRLI